MSTFIKSFYFSGGVSSEKYLSHLPEKNQNPELYCKAPSTTSRPHPALFHLSSQNWFSPLTSKVGFFFRGLGTSSNLNCESWLYQSRRLKWADPTSGSHSSHVMLAHLTAAAASTPSIISNLLHGENKSDPDLYVTSLSHPLVNNNFLQGLGGFSHILNWLFFHFITRKRKRTRVRQWSYK